MWFLQYGGWLRTQCFIKKMACFPCKQTPLPKKSFILRGGSDWNVTFQTSSNTSRLKFYQKHRLKIALFIFQNEETHKSERSRNVLLNNEHPALSLLSWLRSLLNISNMKSGVIFSLLGGGHWPAKDQTSYITRTFRLRIFCTGGCSLLNPRCLDLKKHPLNIF